MFTFLEWVRATIEILAIASLGIIFIAYMFMVILISVNYFL